MGRLFREFADSDVALQDAFTVVVSTEVVVTMVGTKSVASPFMFWVLGKLKLTVLLGQLAVDVILIVTGARSAT